MGGFCMKNMSRSACQAERRKAGTRIYLARERKEKKMETLVMLKMPLRSQHRSLSCIIQRPCTATFDISVTVRSLIAITQPRHPFTVSPCWHTALRCFRQSVNTKSFRPLRLKRFRDPLWFTNDADPVSRPDKLRLFAHRNQRRASKRIVARRS